MLTTDIEPRGTTVRTVADSISLAEEFRPQPAEPSRRRRTADGEDVHDIGVTQGPVERQWPAEGTLMESATRNLLLSETDGMGG